MSCIHRLQHVNRFRPAHLADHNPVRAHPKRCADQLADRDLPLSVNAAGSRLQAHKILYVLDLELRIVLDRDQPLAVRYEGRQRI